jgi:hypothetical protein
VEDLIQEFSRIDATGEVFRYPEDGDGNKHLEGLSLINVEVLAEGMEALQELFAKWSGVLDNLVSP